MTISEKFAARLAEARNETPYTLAGFADCAYPDDASSPGAALLASMRDVFCDTLESMTGDVDSQSEIADIINEVTQNGPSVYTHDLWREFVDLGAYMEDVSDWGVDLSDPTTYPNVALRIILDRLCTRLAEDIIGDDDDTDGDE